MLRWWAEETVRPCVRWALANFKFRQLILAHAARTADFASDSRICCINSLQSIVWWWGMIEWLAWLLRVEDQDSHVRMENGMLRWMCHSKYKFKVEKRKERLGVKGEATCLRRGGLKWFGQVKRKARSDWTRASQLLLSMWRKDKVRKAITFSRRNVQPVHVQNKQC